MTDSVENPDTGAEPADLKDRVWSAIEAIVGGDGERAAEDLEHLVRRARELIDRKHRHAATKSETRDLIGELMFARLRHQLARFVDGDEGRDANRAAEWVLGAMCGVRGLSEFAAAFDSAMLDAATPRDISFAGRADFISIEEVMQLLGTGKHTGRLTIENNDRRLDLYFQDGTIALLDPHELERRVLPGASQMSYREIKREEMAEARQQMAQGTPLLLALQELGCFRDLDLGTVLRQLGTEVLFDFLREQEALCFFYRRLDRLPGHVVEHALRLRVTPVLLEGSKRLDDWRGLERVFPDPAAAVEPLPDMFAKISEMNLGVLEIKLLSLIDGERSPRDLVELLGLPLQDVYQVLVRFAKEGAVVAPGGWSSFAELILSGDESMDLAFEALDANDDERALGNALDRVLGDGPDDGEGIALGGAAAALLEALTPDPDED